MDAVFEDGLGWFWFIVLVASTAQVLSTFGEALVVMSNVLPTGSA